jgi:hypothetical protein
MTFWRWAAIAGLAVLCFTIAFGAIPGIDACGAGGNPILAFEFVTSPAEVAAQFPPDCRDVHAAAQYRGLWIDAMGFIPVYSAFLILQLFALDRERPSPVARWAMLAVLAAAASDQFEGIQLFRILADLPGTQDMIDLLMPAVRIKFALLAAVGIAIGALHLRFVLWRKLFGSVMIAGGLVSLAGLFGRHELVIQGSTLSWTAMLIAAIILSLRRDNANQQREQA